MFRSAALRVPTLARGVHVEKRLAELGITLPPVNPPVANYRLCNIVGKVLFTGALPLRRTPSQAI